MVLLDRASNLIVLTMVTVIRRCTVDAPSGSNFHSSSIHPPPYGNCRSVIGFDPLSRNLITQL